jgi:hypothetical protein
MSVRRLKNIESFFTELIVKLILIEEIMGQSFFLCDTPATYSAA